MPRESHLPTRWVLAVVLSLVAAGCGPGEDASATLTGHLAVADEDWAFDTFVTGWNIVTETIMDCAEVDSSAQENCEQDRDRYIEAAVHTLDCAEGVGGGYSDLRVGAQVVVSDSTQEIVGLGQLDSARVANLAPLDAEASALACIFSFTVTDLPQSEFYSLAVGSRDPVVYRREQMEAMNWDLELFLGLDVVPQVRLAEYRGPGLPEGPVPDYTNTPSSTTTTTRVAATTSPPESSSGSGDGGIETFQPESPPPKPAPPEPLTPGAGVAVDANVDCSGNNFVITYAVRNITDTTQQLSQAGFFPGGPIGHALLYLEFGSIMGRPVAIEPHETVYHSEGFVGLDWLEPGSVIDVYADFDSGGYNAERQVHCP